MDPAANLQRFIDAQESVYADVLAELRAGHKESHWMWFIFPQLRGLGNSPLAMAYAIASLQEARDYLQHPLLGPRLRECTELALAHSHKSAEDIFGYPDWLKFRSCMTLFSVAAVDEQLFAAALAGFYSGKGDALTLDLVKSQ